jgi:NTP pyrophosphatase (non-canonical NTP hydrolase)
MNLQEYKNGVGRTLAVLPTKEDDINHMLRGVITEIGELTDIYKKHDAYGAPFDEVHVSEEIGDLMWYIMGLCIIYDFDLEDILQRNIDKLRERYPEKFSREYATSRDLTKERKALGGKS